MHDYINHANILNEKNKEMKGRMNGNITNNNLIVVMLLTFQLLASF